MAKHLMRWLRVVVILLLGTLVSPAHALEVPPLQGRVNDLADVIPAPAEQAMSQRLQAFEQKTGFQYAVLTVPSLEGDPIEDFGIRVVEAWKLGREGKDDGLLVLVAVADKRMRIEVGYGLEGAIPDALAGRIVRDVMAPQFRQGDYAGGIDAALGALFQAGAGESVALPEPQPERRERRGGGFKALFWLMMLGFMFIGPLFGRRRRLGYGPMMLGGFYGGSRGGGFGGGGFSGGGGGFGGGGASGSW